MNTISLNKVILALVASFIFMAGVRVAVEMAYPDGTANLTKGKISVVTTSNKQVAKR
jgi:hypothetical protein